LRVDVSRERTADLYNLQRVAPGEGDGNVVPAQVPAAAPVLHHHRSVGPQGPKEDA